MSENFLPISRENVPVGSWGVPSTLSLYNPSHRAEVRVNESINWL